MDDAWFLGTVAHFLEGWGFSPTAAIPDESKGGRTLEREGRGRKGGEGIASSGLRGVPGPGVGGVLNGLLEGRGSQHPLYLLGGGDDGQEGHLATKYGGERREQWGERQGNQGGLTTPSPFSILYIA